jgi:hypothetical protein
VCQACPPRRPDRDYSPAEIAIRPALVVAVNVPAQPLPATGEHPAQTQLITEDEIVGFSKTIKQSGAIPKPDR